jgi:hypothetical protein
MLFYLFFSLKHIVEDITVKFDSNKSFKKLCGRILIFSLENINYLFWYKEHCFNYFNYFIKVLNNAELVRESQNKSVCGCICMSHLTSQHERYNFKYLKGMFDYVYCFSIEGKTSFVISNLI